MTEFTGSIIELNEKKAIVMTEACDFVSIHRQSEMFIGQQVKFQKSDINRTNKNYMKYFALAASVFIITLCSVFSFQIFVPSTVFAYIDVDINPSMEFVIDKNAKVLDLNPLNNDAQTLLKNLKLINLPIKEAIAEVVRVSTQYGFISTSKKNAVLISASTDRDKIIKKNSSEEVVLDNILSDIGSITFDVGTENIKPEVLKVTPEVRESAVKNDISMGRYALYSKIKEENVDITVEKAKTERVSDMLDKAKIKVFSKNKSDATKSDKNKYDEKDSENSNVNKAENSSNSGSNSNSNSNSSNSNSNSSSSVDEKEKTSSNVSKNQNTAEKERKDELVRHKYTNYNSFDKNNRDLNRKSEDTGNSKVSRGNYYNDTRNNYNYIPKYNETDKISYNGSATESAIQSNAE
ncbi:MAG TPA: anti-sigma factor domain-containing protein [Ruminiclostridium sp.]